jgi:hypothetical protein
MKHQQTLVLIALLGWHKTSLVFGVEDNGDRVNSSRAGFAHFARHNRFDNLQSRRKRRRFAESPSPLIV